MVETGKSYHLKGHPKHQKYKVLAKLAHNEVTFFVVVPHFDYECFDTTVAPFVVGSWAVIEEPMEIIRYVNIYANSVGGSMIPLHRSRRLADWAAGYKADKSGMRIACKKITIKYNEGEFDE